MSEWIISSSVLIVMVIALRYVLRGKINLRLQYALWLVVLVRLLMPVSLANSSFSVAGLLQGGLNYELSDIYLWYGDEDAEQGGDVLPDNEGNEVQEGEGQNGVQNDQVGGENPENRPGNEDTPVAPKPDETPEKDPVIKEEPKYPEIGGVSIAPSTEKLENSGKEHLSLSGILTAIWCVGMTVTGVALLVSNLRFLLKLRKTSWLYAKQEGELPVYENSVIETPCLFGLIHPAVYVTPEAIRDPKMMHHVLTHETTHYAHRDHIWAALRCLCLVLHWYNPLVWWAAALSRRDAELACDEGAIERIGEAVRAEYGRTLIGLTCQGRSHLLSTATTMTGSVKGIKERIMLIANRPKMARYTVMILIVLVVGLIGCTYCGKKETDTGLGQTEESTEGKEPVLESAGEATEEPTTEDTFTEESTEEPTTEEEPLSVVTDLTAHYLRWRDSSEEGTIRVIRTEEEYETYCEQEKQYVSKEKFQAIAGRFDKAFWENYDLALTGLVLGDSGTRLEVLSMTRSDSSDTEWYINLRPLLNVGNCVLTAWTVIVEVPEGVLKEGEEVKMNYSRDSGTIHRNIRDTYVRTDMWKPEDGDEFWYLHETPLYIMETKEELNAYCEAHPELSEGFIELCGRYDDQFWEDCDLLFVVKREEISAVHYAVGDFFKNPVLSSDTWFLEWVRKVPETQVADEAIWHFFVEVDKKYKIAEKHIEIHERLSYVEDKDLLDVQYLYSKNDAVVETDPKIRLISSQEQLDLFYETNKDKYNLTERWANYYYEKIREEYNSVFWEQNDLILISLEGNVGPYWYTLTEIEWQPGQSGECKLTIEAATNYPESTVKLAYRHLFVAVPKGKVTDPGMVSLEFVEGEVKHVD